MLSIDFEGTNRTFGPPANMTDEECMTVHAKVFQGDKGLVTRLAFQPSKEDIEAFVAGRPVIVDLYAAGGLCPIGIFTLDNEGQINE